ncbi:MAG: gliding motility lipoprotein GldD, partial [Bacteroidota bacterium]
MHKNLILKTVLICITILAISSCKKEVLPKPSSQLRLEYPVAEYANFESNCPFTFFMNEDAIIKGQKECGFTITYP